MKPVFTSEAPTPSGHYSQGISTQNLIFISGQLATGYPPETPLAEQVKIALERIVAIAKAGGSSKDQIVKTTIYISDVNDWPAVNEAYAEFFGDKTKPARSTVPIGALLYGYKVEIEAIAEVNEEVNEGVSE